MFYEKLYQGFKVQRQVGRALNFNSKMKVGDFVFFDFKNFKFYKFYERNWRRMAQKPNMSD